jgi:FkbM family methyltransferase
MFVVPVRALSTILVAAILLHGFFVSASIATDLKTRDITTHSFQARKMRIHMLYADHPCTKVFLDLGANIGDTLGKFVNHAHFLSKIEYEAGDFCYFGFEGNPHLSEDLIAAGHQLTSRGVPNVVFTDVLVTGADGMSFLYLDVASEARYHEWGSSVHKTQTALRNKVVPVPVHTFALSTILEQFPRDAEVWIKMDIEGGEYNSLTQLLINGDCARINTLFLEFHDQKFKADSFLHSLHSLLLQQLKGCGVHLSGDTD